MNSFIPFWSFDDCKLLHKVSKLVDLEFWKSFKNILFHFMMFPIIWMRLQNTINVNFPYYYNVSIKEQFCRNVNGIRETSKLENM
jgi:hypothetical protein